MAMAGALATAIAIRLYHLVMDGVMGLAGQLPADSRATAASLTNAFSSGLRRIPRRGPFFVSAQDSAAFTRPDARAGSIDAPSRSFTSAITRPMSFIEHAPVSATISRIFASASASLSLRGQEALDHRDFALPQPRRGPRGRSCGRCRPIRGAA